MITGNEPAFETQGNAATGALEGGLTIRQYFAAMAMQGIMASMPAGGLYSNGHCHAQKNANDCVVMADALIAELNKEK